jgi:hypothetical protein
LDVITKVLQARRTVGAPDVVKPVGLHFVVGDKISGHTHTLRAKVNRKVKVGTKKFSVVRLDDFNAVADNKSPSGSVFLI